MKVVYRIVNAILGALTFVVAFFADFIYVEIGTSNSLSDVISSLAEGVNGVALAEDISIKRMIDIYTGKDDLSGFMKAGDFATFYWNEELQKLDVRLIIFAIAFVLILAISLFIIIYSCCSNKRLPIFIAGLAGIVCVIVFICVFRSMSTDIYNGTVNIVDYVVDTMLGEGVLASLVGAAASSAVTLAIALDGVQVGFLGVFAGVVIWTAIFWVVDIGDPNVKKEQEALKEAKAKKKAEKAAKKAAKKAAAAQ